MFKWWEDNNADEGKKGGNNEVDPELSPEVVKQKLAALDGLNEKVGKIDDVVKSLEALTSSVTQMQQSEQQRREAEEEERKRRAAPPKKETAEELSERLIEDPEGTINQILLPQNEAILELRADRIRDELFSDPERFPYYSGELKAEVNKVLSEQPVAFRQKAENVKNVYDTIIGRHFQEIQEGKLKSRFAGASSSKGDGGEGEKEAELVIEITDDIRKAARHSGMSAEDYAKLLAKEAKEGNINYV